jgi:hypothetical protein
VEGKKMARIQVSYKVLLDNRIEVHINKREGDLFGKFYPFYYSKEKEEIGICQDPKCREDIENKHEHAEGIYRKFNTVTEAAEWTENLLKEIETYQTDYLATRKALQKELPNEIELILAE